MIWYTIEKCHNEWYVFKNVNIHGMACKGIFKGSLEDCKKYCKKYKLKLGEQNGQRKKYS